MKFVTLRYENQKPRYLKTANDRMMYKFKLCTYIRGVIVALEILNWEIDDWLNQDQ